MAQYIGIEIGGTKLQVGIGPGNGTLARLWRGTVDVAAGPEGIRKQITLAVPELLFQSKIERSQIAGVGIGFGGPVDDTTRTIIKSHQIEGWADFPLADWVNDMLGWPTALANDADVAGLAEALFGAGQGVSPVFYITIGSGIGGGLIIDGEIYRGSGRGAAEIGHLRLPVPNLLAPNDRAEYASLESVASGWAIEERLRRFVERNPHHAEGLSLLAGGPSGITTRQVAQAIKAGDSDIRALFETPVACLAEAICHVIALLCPRRIIIGGGVSLMGECVLFEPLRKMVAEQVFKPFAGCYDIVPAALGEEVVVHGALTLAQRRLGRDRP